MSLALWSTASMEAAISPMDSDVPETSWARPSVFSPICREEMIICSMEPETLSICLVRADAVWFSSSPAAPSSRIELLASSTFPVSPWAESLMPPISRSMEATSRAACSSAVAWAALASLTLSPTSAMAEAPESTLPAVRPTRSSVPRSDAIMRSTSRPRSPISSSDSKALRSERSPAATLAARRRSFSRLRATSLEINPETANEARIAAASTAR